MCSDTVFSHEVSIVLTVTTALWKAVHAVNHNSRNSHRQPSKSSVWNSFDKNNENEVQCKHCKLEKLYDSNACALRSRLTSVEKVSLTTYSWTALTSESYVTVTCHHFSKWKTQSAALHTKAMLEQHTAENLVNWREEKQLNSLPLCVLGMRFVCVCVLGGACCYALIQSSVKSISSIGRIHTVSYLSAAGTGCYKNLVYTVRYVILVPTEALSLMATMSSASQPQCDVAMPSGVKPIWPVCMSAQVAISVAHSFHHHDVWPQCIFVFFI